MKKGIVLLAVIAFLSSKLSGQSMEIPENVQLTSKEDYKKQETLVLKGIDWIHETSLDKDKEKRKEVNAFLMRWMTGSPSVSIKLVGGIVPMECGECLMSFLAGWTKYSLENNYSKDTIENALAGVNRFIGFYEKNKNLLKKTSEVKTLLKKKKKGKLKKYIASKF